MIQTIGPRTIRIAFMPPRMQWRMALHSAASIVGAVFAVRLGSVGAWWSYPAWYAGSFVGFHVVLVPFLATWFAVQVRFEAWIRSLVEQEMIRMDLHAYDRQVKRIFPTSKQPPDEGTPI